MASYWWHFPGGKAKSLREVSEITGHWESTLEQRYASKNFPEYHKTPRKPSKWWKSARMSELKDYPKLLKMRRDYENARAKKRPPKRKYATEEERKEAARKRAEERRKKGLTPKMPEAAFTPEAIAKRSQTRRQNAEERRKDPAVQKKRKERIQRTDKLFKRKLSKRQQKDDIRRIIEKSKRLEGVKIYYDTTHSTYIQYLPFEETEMYWCSLKAEQARLKNLSYAKHQGNPTTFQEINSRFSQISEKKKEENFKKKSLEEELDELSTLTTNSLREKHRLIREVRKVKDTEEVPEPHEITLEYVKSKRKHKGRYSVKSIWVYYKKPLYVKVLGNDFKVIKRECHFCKKEDVFDDYIRRRSYCSVWCNFQGTGKGPWGKPRNVKKLRAIDAKNLTVYGLANELGVTGASVLLACSKFGIEAPLRDMGTKLASWLNRHGYHRNPQDLRSVLRDDDPDKGERYLPDLIEEHMDDLDDFFS